MTDSELTDLGPTQHLPDNPVVAIYARVSTQDQSLQRQVRDTMPYAEHDLGADTGDVTVDDVAGLLERVGGGDPIDAGDVTIYHDKSTGTDTARDGYRNLMVAVDEARFDAVVVHDTTRLSRSLQDIDATVERVTDAGAELHFVRDSLPPFTPGGSSDADGVDDPMSRLMLQILGAFAEWEARTKRMNTIEGIAARREADDEYHHGRSPLGFGKEDGQLYQDTNYDQVVAVLESVSSGNLSKRKAAKTLDTSRATINRALDRRELYGL